MEVALTGSTVYLNVYDLYFFEKNYGAPVGLGLYHTGVEVNGKEYGFCCHPFDFSGIFEMVPRDVNELAEKMEFKESINMGKTIFTQDEIEKIIHLLGRDFKGKDYNVLEKNCNHFTDRLCKILTGMEIPSYINRLTSWISCVPFIKYMMPDYMLDPTILKDEQDVFLNYSRLRSNNRLKETHEVKQAPFT